MIGFDISQAKKMFFDLNAVMTAEERGVRRALSTFGRNVRATSRQSIRSSKSPNPSPPGRPPRSRTGLLKRFIFYIYEPNRRNVVIGPAAFRGKSRAPELLEHGGEIVTRRRRSRGGSRVVRAVYPARPFMVPAFEQEKTNLPDIWRDSIK